MNFIVNRTIILDKHHRSSGEPIVQLLPSKNFRQHCTFHSFEQIWTLYIYITMKTSNQPSGDLSPLSCRRLPKRPKSDMVENENLLINLWHEKVRSNKSFMIFSRPSTSQTLPNAPSMFRKIAMATAEYRLKCFRMGRRGEQEELLASGQETSASDNDDQIGRKFYLVMSALKPRAPPPPPPPPRQPSQQRRGN